MRGKHEAEVPRPGERPGVFQTGLDVFHRLKTTSALSFGSFAVEELHTRLNSSRGKNGRCLLELSTESDIKYNKNQHKGTPEAVSVRTIYT